MENNKYLEAIKEISREQEKIIGGDMAILIIKNIPGLKIEKSGSSLEINIEGNPKEILGKVVDQYATFFGQASILVSKEALKDAHLSFYPEELPENLK